MVRASTAFVLTLIAVALILQACQPKPSSTQARTTTVNDEEKSRKAFLAAYTVLMHPRCMNCHPAGDQPLQGDDAHIHTMNVQRGSDGKGRYALKCANCHQLKNLPGEHMPPGNPMWHLPPADMKMVFQGKSPAQLAAQLKDPNQNGHKTLEQIYTHVATDQLVIRSGWDPGNDRATPALTHEQFAQAMRTWIDNGAAIPRQ